ncbi:RNHCP domain-containing protein [bacterium]|nr:RNHCP domain-containing protein [bacterium]
MNKQKQLNKPFRCVNCRTLVYPDGAGSSHRNHCPNCLHSLHVDQKPGDRSNPCQSDMEPVAIWVRKGSEWAIIHRCTGCGAFKSNRTAADDNPYVLLKLAARPLVESPFPIERVEGL